MNKVNYSLVMEDEIKKISCFEKKPSLLLHSCCAPCSSFPLELLCENFDVTVFYYNPNIYPEKEYYKRCDEQERFCSQFIKSGCVNVVIADYDGDDFKKISAGLENEKELGRRCTECYRLRLEKTAKYASENNYDYFTTTLTVSPLKCAQRLNHAGEQAGEKYGVKFLNSDFKKKNGYRRSCEISEQYGIYRQDYCGCIYSMAERYIDSAKAFIFDADGTLCDTMEFYEVFLDEYAKSINLTLKSGFRDQIRGFTLPQACVYLCETHEINKTPDEVMEDIDKIVSDFYKTAMLKDGVKEFLQYAYEKGIRMCVATATEKKYIEKMLEYTGIKDFFEFVITSTEVGRGKKYPDIYLKAAEMLGADVKNSIVFEDVLHAIKTAKSAGFKVVAVEDRFQMDFKDEIKNYSDFYVDSLMNLVKREKL